MRPNDIINTLAGIGVLLIVFSKASCEANKQLQSDYDQLRFDYIQERAREQHLDSIYPDAYDNLDPRD